MRQGTSRASPADMRPGCGPCALLVCRGLPSVRAALAKPVFRALCREVGLPDAIRTDTGAPFAANGIHGLSALNVWWMQLGLVHQRILPASPQENGQHERMHRELKRETVWTTSTRDYPARILPPDSPAHLEVRCISSTGAKAKTLAWRRWLMESGITGVG